MDKYIVKSDNKITEFESGLKKDNIESKVRFDLIPYYVFKRVAMQFTNGAKKYGEDNWKKASNMKEAHIFLEAAERHTLQWVEGVVDNEDHAAAAITNIMMYEWHKMNKTNE